MHEGARVNGHQYKHFCCPMIYLQPDKNHLDQMLFNYLLFLNVNDRVLSIYIPSYLVLTTCQTDVDK